MTNTKGKLSGILLGMQAIFVLLFGLFLSYGDQVGPLPFNSTEHASTETLTELYPMYQDVHVMMLVGFGFLYQFLKRYGFGSLGFTFLLLCYVIEWSVLVNGWFDNIGVNEKISVTLESLLHADFAAATILISFGAILGIASPVQLIIMATLEVVFYNVSLFVGIKIFGTLDVGGTIFVHTFGAYFGVVVARILYKKAQTTSDNEGAKYSSDIAALVGTLFLWLFWPSFNSAPASGNERHRAVVNTVLSLSACTVVTIAISSLMDKKGKLNMVHIQNATLAGGVVMGASADLILHPYGALLVGSFAAIISTLGFQYLQPFLLAKLKLHDTCGAHNLHGITGIFGAIISAIVISTATKEAYLSSYDKLFSRENFSPYYIELPQAGAQIVALVVTIVIALLGGAITGFILKLPFWDNFEADEMYEDKAYWLVEEPEKEDQTNGVYELTNRKEESEKI